MNKFNQLTAAKKTISIILIIALVCSIAFFTIGCNKSKILPGDGTKDSPYIISTAESLMYVAKMINSFESGSTGDESHYASAYYELDTSIDLSGYDWEPMCKADGSKGFYNEFYGTFDGNGYGIYNLNISQAFPDCSQYGLFGYNKGVIKNLNIINATIMINDADRNGSTSICAGGIVGENNGSIENCAVENISIKVDCNDYVSVGAIAGSHNNGEIVNVVSSGDLSVVASHSRVGGAIGDISTKSLTKKTCFEGNIYVNSNQIYAGGFCGEIDSASANVTIQDCFTVAKLRTDLKGEFIYTGGFVGGMGVIREEFVLRNLYCKTKMESYPSYENKFIAEFLKLGDCPIYHVSNCVTISDEKITTHEVLDSTGYSTNEYSLSNTNINDFFKNKLKFDSFIWDFDNGNLPTF